MENAVGFLRRNLMVPPLEAETHTQLGRIMLDRCDALAASSRHYRRGAAIGDVFGEDRAALMPLPSTTFDPIRWESRRADKYGQIDIDSNRYLAGPALHGRRLLAAVRWDSVQITDPGTGEIVAGYPRIYGRSPSTLQDPELAMPVLAAKPGFWRESSIRPDFPEDVRAWLDEADSKRLAQSLRSIGAACAAAGFGNAVAAASRAIADRPGSALDESTLVTLALRARDADDGAITDDGPDLAGYDRFITGDGGKEAGR